MQEAAPGRPILHLGPPAALVRAWRTWATDDPGQPRWTVTASRSLSHYLLTRLPPALDHRVLRLWDLAWLLRPEGMPFIPYEGLPSLLANDVRAAVGPRWRGPGAAEALLEAATLIRRDEERLEALAAVPSSWRDALAIASARIEQVVRRGYDEVRLYRYAASTDLAPLRRARVAIYGMMEPRPAQTAFLAALVRAFPVTVFLPWTAGPADAYVAPWLAWWQASGATIVESPQESPSLVGISAPGVAFDPFGEVIRQGARLDPDARDWAAGTSSADEAAGFARWLRAEGAPVCLDPGPVHVDDRLRVVLRAAMPDARADAILTWLRQSAHPVTSEERRVLARNARRSDAWPSRIRLRTAALQRALDSVLTVRRFAELPPALDRLSESAGMSFDRADETSERLFGFDAAGIRPDRQSVMAWLENAGTRPSTPGPGVRVSTLWELRGTHHRRLMITGLDAEALASAPEWDTGTAAGWILAAHPERQARREMGVRHLQALMLLSADVVYILGAPERPWPAHIRPAEIVAGEPPRTGPGLRVSRLRRAPAFGPFDGTVDPASVPRPHSASGYETFGRCPLQYAFSVMGVPPWPFDRPDPDASQIGIWAHRALEKVLTAGRERPPLPTLLATVRREIERAMEDNPPPDDVLPFLVELAVDALTADLTWYLLSHWPTGRVLAEAKWEYGTLSGVIDRVEFSDSGVVVVDYKTGRVPAAVPSPTTLQLPLYAEAAHRTFAVPYERIRASYQGVRASNEFRTVDLPGRVDQQVDAAHEILTAIDTQIDAGRLYLNPQDGACRSCDFRPACTWDAARDAARKLPNAPVFRDLWQKGKEPGTDPLAHHAGEDGP